MKAEEPRERCAECGHPCPVCAAVRALRTEPEPDYRIAALAAAEMYPPDTEPEP